MASFVCALFAIYGLLVLVARIAIQKRRTGDSGLRLGQALSLSVAGLAKLLLILGAGLSAFSPFYSSFAETAPLWSPTLALLAVGLALYVLGLTLTFAAQLQMGASWRIGVDPSERTALVVRGLFRWVRNPIYTAVLLCFAGCATLLPTVGALAGWVITWLALQLQVRAVEEPYLRSVHGDAFLNYAHRVGRFVPGVGKFSA